LEEHPDRSCASKREADIKKLPKTAKEALVANHRLMVNIAVINSCDKLKSFDRLKVTIKEFVAE
jgi:hypothetical protein